METISLRDFLNWKPPVVQEIISNGILLPESSMIIHGLFGSWKTMLSMHTIFCLATGTPWFGFGVAKSRVLSIQTEVGKLSWFKRITKYCENIKEKPLDSIEFGMERYLKLDSSFGMADLDKTIARTKPDIVFIDPLYKVVGGDLNDSRDMTKFTDNLDILMMKHHCSFVIVHHDHKSKYDEEGKRLNQGAEAITGSQVLNNWPATVLGIDVTSPKEANPVTATISFDKIPRDSDTAPKPINVSIDREDIVWREVTTIKLTDDMIDLMANMPTPEEDIS